MAQRRYITWIDANGFTRLTLLNSSVGCAGVQTALLALSNADVLNSLDAALSVNSTPAPSTSLYPRVADCASIVYADAGGNQLSVQLPAPASSVFLADQATVDPAAIAALSAQIIGTLLTQAGGVITAFVGGYRRPTTKEDYQ